MSLTEPLPKVRNHGVDLVRLLSFIAITFHHYTWVLWYAAPPHEATHFGWHWIAAYARTISFSGHTVLFLSCYLIARTETRVAKTWKVVALVTVGWFIFCLFEWGQNPVFWIWDIYPLISLGLVTCILALRVSPQFLYLLGALGFALTWFDFWNWPFFEAFSLQWRHWLVGDCRVDLADWPILPWIGIIWTPYAIGTWDRLTTSGPGQSRLGKWKKWEWAAWTFLLLVSLPQLGIFYRIELGPMFACYSFRQAPPVFWSHFIFVVFLLRLSLVERVQALLDKSRFVRAIGDLRISRSFGVAYLIHYTLIEFICRMFRPELAPSDDLAAVVAFAILPLTEISVRAVEFVFSLLRRSSSKRLA